MVSTGRALAARGATLPYTEYEAEAGSTNATRLGPSTTYLTTASEASGRQAVRLSSTGQYVRVTLTAPTNSVVVRYSIPDNAAGTGQTAPLSLYAGSTKIASHTPGMPVMIRPALVRRSSRASASSWRDCAPAQVRADRSRAPGARGGQGSAAGAGVAAVHGAGEAAGVAGQAGEPADGPLGADEDKGCRVHPQVRAQRPVHGSEEGVAIGVRGLAVAFGAAGSAAAPGPTGPLPPHGRGWLAERERAAGGGQQRVAGAVEEPGVAVGEDEDHVPRGAAQRPDQVKEREGRVDHSARPQRLRAAARVSGRRLMAQPTRRKDWAGPPVQVHCCSRAPSAVETSRTSRHLPLWRATNR